jgi:hypothetical protein
MRAGVVGRGFDRNLLEGGEFLMPRESLRNEDSG